MVEMDLKRNADVKIDVWREDWFNRNRSKILETTRFITAFILGISFILFLLDVAYLSGLALGLIVSFVVFNLH